MPLNPHGSTASFRLRKFQNIECRDAVLAFDGEPQPARDENGKEITVWDQRSTKTDPLTRREVPDEKKRVRLLKYINPRQATWPGADFIVGNPPYLGARTIRPALGDGYLEALRQAHQEVADNVDYVMYWWHKAANIVRGRKAIRFGFITTNSFAYSFNRSVVEPQMTAAPPLSIAFAIPDHPWVDATDGADVRIAMTVGVLNRTEGVLETVVEESKGASEGASVKLATQVGEILPNLTIGVDVGRAVELEANRDLCCVGYQLSGRGFTLTNTDLSALTSTGRASLNEVIFPLLSARDITQEPRNLVALDLFGYSTEELRSRFPQVYQWVVTRVKPERDLNNRETVRDRWWIFGEARSTFRPAIAHIARIVVTPLTAKHRTFIFAPPKTIADSTTVMFALEDAFCLGILSSRIHVCYALAAGARLGVGHDPRYNKSRCFDPFPFPTCDDKAKDRIRKIAEELDAHRKRVQAQHPGLTLTGMYNVLEKLRANEPLTEKEQRIHDMGLVSVLRQLHDDLDAAVFAAYGWPTTLTDAEILERLVSLNAERAKEEASGLIRWLRPEYQNPGGAKPEQRNLKLPAETPQTKPGRRQNGKLTWPKTLPERAKAVSLALSSHTNPMSAVEIAKCFRRAKPADAEEILDTLCAMGKAKKNAEAKYML